MLKKAYTPFSLLLQSLVLLFAGILFFLHPEQTLAGITSILYILLLLSAGNSVLQWIFRRGEKRPALGEALFKIALVVFLKWKPASFAVSLSLIYGLWISINALSKFLMAWQLHSLKQRGKIINFIEAWIYLFFALYLITAPLEGSYKLTVILGIYSLVRAVFAFLDFLRELMGTDINGKRLRQRVRINPPVLLTALLPMAWLRTLEDPNEEAEVEKWTREETVLEDVHPQLEIFIHLSKATAFGFGHVDIALNDKVYSFGCYDESSSRLFGVLSDGVLVVANKEPYIPYCLENEKKRLLSYSVVLRPEQVQAMEKKIADFLEDSVEWIPDEKVPQQQEFAKKCGTKFYKIKHGPFQTYNVLSTNCVAVANIFSGSGGVDLMNSQGIVTPGTYSEFLDRQFRRPKSIVVGRKVYR